MSDQSPPCSSAAYLSIALSLDYAQNPLRRNTLTRFGANRRRKLALWPVAVEKGTKAVISAKFSVYGERTINNLRTTLIVETR